MRLLSGWTLAAAICLAGGAPACGQINGSFIWCEPSTSLTYCLKLATPGLIAATNAAAAAWSAATPWTLSPVAGCANADIVVQEQQANIFLALLAQTTTDTIGTFEQTTEGSEDVFGVIKPCLEQGTITYYPNLFPVPFAPGPLALHEFGHALRLLDNNVAASVMKGVGVAAAAPSPADITNATQSAGAANINQFHKLLQPRGGVLAFSGVELEVPPGALPEPGTVVGIRPLLASSIPGAALPAGFDRVVTATDVVAEYSRGELEVGAPFTLKRFPLDAPVSLRMEVPEEAVTAAFAVAPAPLAAARSVEEIRDSLRLARLAEDRSSWQLVDAGRTGGEGAVAFEAEVDALGTYAVLGRTLRPAVALQPPPAPPERTPIRWPVVASAFGAGLLAGWAGLWLRRRQLSASTASRRS